MKVKTTKSHHRRQLEEIVHEQTLFTIASRVPFEVMYLTIERLERDSGNTSYTMKDFMRNHSNKILDVYNEYKKFGNHTAQYVSFSQFYMDVFEAELNPGMVKKYLTGGG